MRKEAVTTEDISVLEFVTDNLAAFSQQIANAQCMWFADVNESLERLVQRGLVSAYKSELGLQGSIFCPTDVGIKLLERKEHGF